MRRFWQVTCFAACLCTALATGCSKSGGAAQAGASGGSNSADAAAMLTTQLDELRSAGRFEQFVDRALVASDDHPYDLKLALHKCEALLASGRNQEAEQAALEAAKLANDFAEPALAGLALKLWNTARFRQAGKLDDPDVADLLSRHAADGASVEMLTFWQQALSTRSPYRLVSPTAAPLEMKLAQAAVGSLPYELAAFEARAGGATLPLVFVDTGAQHTLMTLDAAKAAGVRLGGGSTRLTGFAGLTAQPGLIEKLDLGGLILHDVPVLVGDSPPLLAAGGQVSLGTDLLQHVRFCIDYPARRVTVEPAGQADRRNYSPQTWSIPLWTFSQICLARGEIDGQARARILVDTGDRAGTFVSYHWARRNLPQLEGPSTSMVFRFKKRNLTLPHLAIGTQTLPAWPVVDTIPRELDRMQLVDIMMGRDLLKRYRLTIDLPGRVLKLEQSEENLRLPQTAALEYGERDDVR
jgi:hypothetical protein